MAQWAQCARLVTDFYPWDTQYEEERTDCCLRVLICALAQTPVHTLHTLIKKRSSFTFQVHTPICLEGTAPNDRTVIWAKLFLFQQLLKFLNECGLVTSSSQKICVYLNNCKCVAVYTTPCHTHPFLTTTTNPLHLLTQGQLPRPQLGCVLHFNFWAVPTEGSGTTSVTLRQKPSSVHFLHPAD